MSVLVKGMELPKNCFKDDCPCLNMESGYCQADKEQRYVDGDRPDWCPLAEVPTPHGRLIDVSTAYQNTMKYGNGTRKLFMKFIDELPTVIETEDE